MSTMRQRGEHGSATTWRQGCTCARCREALHEAAQVWKAVGNMRRGREPASWVPARRVVRHVDRLRAGGMTMADIAAVAGVDRTTLYRCRRPGARVSRTVERRVLDVDVAPTVASGAVVDAAPVVERVAELLAAGLRLIEVAERAGVSVSVLQRAQRDGRRVRSRTVRGVLEVPDP